MRQVEIKINQLHRTPFLFGHSTLLMPSQKAQLSSEGSRHELKSSEHAGGIPAFSFEEKIFNLHVVDSLSRKAMGEALRTRVKICIHVDATGL